MGNQPLPTPKVYFSSLDKKEKITRCLGGEYPKLDSFFCDGQIKVHRRKGKN
jgi:hypothetical protein